MLNQWNTVFSVAKSAIKERLAEILVFLGAIPVIKERAVPVMDDNNVTALGTYTSASNTPFLCKSRASPLTDLSQETNSNLSPSNNPLSLNLI